MLHELITNHGPVWINKRLPGRPKNVSTKLEPLAVKSFIRPKYYTEGLRVLVDFSGKRRFESLSSKYGIKIQVTVKGDTYEYQTYYRGVKKYTRFLKEFILNS